MNEPVPDLTQAWETYESRLRAFLARRVASPSDVDELLQIVSLKAVEKIATLREGEHLDRWLLRIARNAWIDLTRRQGRDPATLDHDFPAETTETYEDVRAELSTCVAPFVEGLPEIYREALRRVDLEGTPQKALATELGLSYSALKSRVQRGRRLLGEALDRCCHFDLDARNNVVDFETRGGNCCP